MLAEKIIFLQIYKTKSKCKNDEPSKNEIGKVSIPFLRPAPATYYHSFF